MMKTTRRHFLKSAGAAGTLLTLGPLGRPFAQGRTPISDVVVLLPGIMGSVLRKDNRDLWAISGGAIMNGFRTLGGSIDQLTLKGDAADVDDLGDGITASRILPDTHLIPGLWKIDGYSKISKFLTDSLDVQRGRNFFEFPYDWRRDARQLARATSGWLKAWRESSGNRDARLILIAHSMGGLVSRYFLEALGGWRDTRMLITFGTPYRGSLNAVSFLANGIRKAVGPLTLVDLSALVRSFTSVYQLLPIYPCYDAGDGTLVRVSEARAVPNVDAQRAARALAFHDDIRTAVERNFRDTAYAAGRYTIHPIVGTYQTTFQTARFTGGKVEMLQTYPGESFDGDGTVPYPSATPVEPAALTLQHKTVYVAEVHGSLQNSTPMLDHVRGLIEEGAVSWDRFRGSTLKPVALMLDDLYSTRERVRVQARCQDAGATLTATLADVRTNRRVGARLMDAGTGGVRHADFGRLAEGTFRVRVSGDDTVGSASDVFVVSRP
jgi:pimeloyl-ACP methyl ester carboxylesterase